MDEDDGIVLSKFIQACDIPAVSPHKTEPFTMVIFGGAGDLSKKKLIPALFHLYRDRELPGEFSIIGFGRIGLNDEQYRDALKGALSEFALQTFEEDEWTEFGRHIFFLSGHFEDDTSYRSLSEKISAVSAAGSDGRITLIYYMAVPPQSTPVVVEKLEKHELHKERFNIRIIVEKPFGRDCRSAAELNKLLTAVFEERQLYRIDHYLGRETVQNIIFFRFSNAIFERLWNSRYIDNVQITFAEDIGVEHRGAFYEQTGVIRDIVQNHMMQLLALLAMEPPIGFDADLIRDEKVKLIRSIKPMTDEEISRFTVCGQYGPGEIQDVKVPGYREEKDVSAESLVPTFFAGKFQIANWRWAGVPFYLRAGKRLAGRITEACIQFKQPPLKLFGRSCDVLEPNVLTLTVKPDEKIALRFGVKYPHEPNKIYPVNMLFSYKDTFKTSPHQPYERLLVDCMRGDLTLFVRQDGVEAMWDVVDPLIGYWENNAKVLNFPNYHAGSWGPVDSAILLQEDGRCWLR